jgi:hypothetical protein
VPQPPHDGTLAPQQQRYYDPRATVENIKLRLEEARELIGEFKFHRNAQTASKLYGSRQFLRPLPQGLVGILSLGLLAPPSGGPSSFCPLSLYHSDVVAFA